MKLALFGGLYSNWLALEAALADARLRGIEAMYCLGDMGAFGPHPDRVFPLLHEHDVRCLRGNYDDSIGHALDDCQCGYTDPRDNHFAAISYEYTLANTSDENRAWLRTLPEHIRLNIDGQRVLLCHGSPRRVNEFVWESASSSAFLLKLADDFCADIICCTHTGLHWHRELRRGDFSRPESSGPSPGGAESLHSRSGGGTSTQPASPLPASSSLFRDPPWGRVKFSAQQTTAWPFVNDARPQSCHWINVGCLGRPANDGRTNVWYTVLGVTADAVNVEFVPVHYDYERLASEMRAEKLPEEFVETVETGYWTTCLEVLPGKERRVGRW